MKAHDVRHLGNCMYCQRFGDKRSSLIKYNGSWSHGSCLFSRIGRKVLDLPLDERTKLSVSDVGIDIMRELIAIDPNRS